MMELRCRENRKFAELDPASLRLEVKCRTCTNREGRDVYHTWAIADILRSVTRDGTVIYPSDAEESIYGDIPCDTLGQRVRK